MDIAWWSHIWLNCNSLHTSTWNGLVLVWFPLLTIIHFDVVVSLLYFTQIYPHNQSIYIYIYVCVCSWCFLAILEIVCSIWSKLLQYDLKTSKNLVISLVPPKKSTLAELEPQEPPTINSVNPMLVDESWSSNRDFDCHCKREYSGIYIYMMYIYNYV